VLLRRASRGLLGCAVLRLEACGGIFLRRRRMKSGRMGGGGSPCASRGPFLLQRGLAFPGRLRRL